MSIGTPKDLLSASFGNKVRDTTRPPSRMAPIAPAAPLLNPNARQSQYGAAPQARGGALGMNRIPYALGSRAEPITNQFTSAPLTNTFANILAGGGRRGGGKYGGFNTATDLEAAVLGSTYELRDVTVPTLRGKANPYLEQISTMRGDAYRQAIDNFNSNLRSPSIPISMTEENNTGLLGMLKENSAYNTRTEPEPLRQYKQELTNWQTEASKPADEYLLTAQQIESTPMAELARSIAINRYGMDPNLAAGKFANVGDDYWKKQRDQEYQALYGMGYEQYEFEQDRLSDLTTGGSKEKIANATLQIENLTGLSIGTLTSAASQTPVQMVENMARVYRIPDPATGNMIEANGAGIVETIRKSIGSGNNQGLQNLYETLIASPGSEGMALLVAALVREYAGQPQKTLEELQDLGIFE